MGFCTIIVVAVSALQLVSARDYCTIASCNGKTHVGCPIPDPPATDTACVSFTAINFSPAQKTLMVSAHNLHRNNVASGIAVSVPTTGAAPFTLPIATDMNKLAWDDELALLASFNVRQCDIKHDACRNTDVYVGQNIYQHSISDTDLGTPETSIPMAVNGWFKEINQFDIPQIASFTGKNNVGHFTQMIWAKTTKIGCAGAKWKDGRWWRYLYTCNYAVGGNYLGNKIYTTGAVAGSACSTRDIIYPNLCV